MWQYSGINSELNFGWPLYWSGSTML